MRSTEVVKTNYVKHYAEMLLTKHVVGFSLRPTFIIVTLHLFVTLHLDGV